MLAAQPKRTPRFRRVGTSLTARHVGAAASTALLLGGAISGAAAAAAPTGLRSVVLTARGGRILAVNVDGSGDRELTHPPGDSSDSGASASPDGGSIAFTRNTGGHGKADVYVMNADGTGLPGFAPEWSPGGSWLAASSGYDSGALVLWGA
jgi:WD40-like Beta Propeller Repeat